MSISDDLIERDQRLFGFSGVSKAILDAQLEADKYFESIRRAEAEANKCMDVVRQQQAEAEAMMATVHGRRGTLTDHLTRWHDDYQKELRALRGVGLANDLLKLSESARQAMEAWQVNGRAFEAMGCGSRLESATESARRAMDQFELGLKPFSGASMSEKMARMAADAAEQARITRFVNPLDFSIYDKRMREEMDKAAALAEQLFPEGSLDEPLIPMVRAPELSVVDLNAVLAEAVEAVLEEQLETAVEAAIEKAIERRSTPSDPGEPEEPLYGNDGVKRDIGFLADTTNK